VSRVVLRIIQLMYFMAPAYVANMVPPFLKYWKGWNPPINRRWLGSHKTVLGFAAGVVAGVLTAAVQSHLGWWTDAIAVRETWLGLGLRFGIGAMAGDTITSFLKRRAAVPSGERWFPFDQIDFVVGALVLIWPVADLSWLDALAILLVSALGHILVNHVGYWLGVRPARW
jgi:CDP-2,3-bis-(O-geranylgeranyl)-sn-glycerol synthase